MEITGKIIVKLDPVSGTSKAGNAWKKQEYVLETQESFPRKVFFDFFGDKADQYNLNIGDLVTLSFDIESREYQGRWYTSIRGWKAVPAGDSSVMGGNNMPPVANNVPEMPQPDFSAAGQTDDLPF